MVDPVCVTCTGIVYERRAIQSHFAKSIRDGMVLRDPFTGQVVSRNMLPCSSLRKRIEEYTEQHRSASGILEQQEYNHNLDYVAPKARL